MYPMVTRYIACINYSEVKALQSIDQIINPNFFFNVRHILVFAL